MALIMTAITSGVIIALLEAVCTGQVYLPVLVYMYKQGIDTVRALYLILWYNLMFILPLLIVFVLTYSGASSNVLNLWLKKKIILIKILLGMVFIVMGVFLITNV